MAERMCCRLGYCTRGTPIAGENGKCTLWDLVELESKHSSEEGVMKEVAVAIAEDRIFSHGTRAIFANRPTAISEMDNRVRRGGGGGAKGISDLDNQLKSFN